MSISDIQRHIIEGAVTKHYLEKGLMPEGVDVSKDMSAFFSEHKIGLPFNISDDNILTGVVSDVSAMNDNLFKSLLNIFILFEAIRYDVFRSMELNTIARDKIKKLIIKQNIINSQLSDYLLSINNSSGYFYSFTDKFFSTKFTDLSYTSAYLDTESGSVSIPHTSDFSRNVHGRDIVLSNSEAIVNGLKVSHITKYPFTNSTDALSNTNWEVEVVTDSQSKVIFNYDMTINSPSGSSDISDVFIVPKTIKPVTVSVYTNDGVNGNKQFGRGNKTSSSKLSFHDSSQNVKTITVQSQKDQADYTRRRSGSVEYVYLFGASDINVSRKSYDTNASLVSNPIKLPTNLADSHSIDKVQLSVSDTVPDGGSISYYIAADNPSASNIDDFSWVKVDPKSGNIDASRVTFNGSVLKRRKILKNPADNDLQLIDINTTDTDKLLRNPTTEIVSGVNIYRITKFEEDFIPMTTTIEEGVNSTRILSIPLDSNAVNSLSFWKDYVNKTLSSQETYGSLDTGDAFFYGGDIGANGKSVYVETYIKTDFVSPTFSKDFLKIDANSKLWEVRIFLNGSELGYLPAGVDKMTLPWKFVKGVNHVAMLVNIPDSTTTSPSPYLGAVQATTNGEFITWGRVRLDEWKYTDMFNIRYNEHGTPATFSIYNGEIVSRRSPSTNLVLTYNKQTRTGPDAIRIRTDMVRHDRSDYISPFLESYSVKFSYGGKQ